MKIDLRVPPTTRYSLDIYLFHTKFLCCYKMTETEMMILGVVALIAIYLLFIKKKDKDDK